VDRGRACGRGRRRDRQLARQGGTADPTDAAPGHQLSHTTVVLDSAILVFREGLETVLVLAAVIASFRRGNRIYRRPVAAAAGSRSPPASAPGLR